MVIGLGFTLFFSGLIGWVGGASESPCLVRLFLFSVVVSMVAEIGGIISLNIVRLQVCILTYLQLRDHSYITYVLEGGRGVREYLFGLFVSLLSRGFHDCRNWRYSLT